MFRCNTPTYSSASDRVWRLIFLRRSEYHPPHPPYRSQRQREGFLMLSFSHLPPSSSPHLHSASTVPQNQRKGFEEANTPLPVSVFHPSGTPVPPQKTALPKLSGWPFLRCSFVTSCAARFTYPRTLVSALIKPVKEWSTQECCLQFLVSGWLVMCLVLQTASMVPLHDNLAEEITIFNQTFIYCTTQFLAWLVLKEWVGCYVPFVPLFVGLWG